MVDTNRLRGAIYTEYPSMAAMADSLGWTRQRLSRIVQGQRVPDVDDVREIRHALKRTSWNEIIGIFFAD